MLNEMRVTAKTRKLRRMLLADGWTPVPDLPERLLVKGDVLWAEMAGGCSGIDGDRGSTRGEYSLTFDPGVPLHVAYAAIRAAVRHLDEPTDQSEAPR